MFKINLQYLLTSELRDKPIMSRSLVVSSLLCKLYLLIYLIGNIFLFLIIYIWKNIPIFEAIIFHF